MFDYSETDEATFRAIINDVESERDALRQVLRGCYTNAVYLNSGFTAPVYRDMLATIAENCRAALAIVDGAK